MTNQKQQPQYWFTILVGVLLTLFLLSGAVVFTLNFRPLYAFDMNFLDIPQLSGLSSDDIWLNYNALIDYNSIFMPGKLQFPTLSMSESGSIHFEEVKNIFVGVQLLCMVCFAGLLALLALGRKKSKSPALKLAALLSLVIPSALGLLIALNWDAFFVGFHKLFFRNDLWLFNPQTDPVINILPDAFFLHCAVMILGLIVAGGALFFLLAKRSSRKIGEWQS